MSAAIAFNGARTLVSEQVGSVVVGDQTKLELPALTPSISNGGGMVVLPLAGMLSALAGQEITPEQMHAVRRGLLKEGASPLDLQVVISEAVGCCYTISDAFACNLVEVMWGVAAGDQLQSVLERIIADCHAKGHTVGDLATFESLSRLHRIAGSPRGRAPGHWFHRRGKRLANAWGKKGSHKGVWKTAAGEWMADHRLAHDYAGLLFPAYDIWTMDVVFDDPVARWKIRGAFESIFGATFTVINPASPQPEPDRGAHLRLVHDADPDGAGGAS